MHYRLGFLLGLVACQLPGEREPLPDWVEEEEDPTGPTPGTEPEPTDTLKLTAGNNNFPVRVRETGTPEAPCEAHPNGTTAGYDEVDCTLDVSELDLYANGIDWSVYLTPGACIYVKFWHYMYEAWEVGLGPTTVSYTLTEGFVSDEVNSIAGVPYCQYDYSWGNPFAPNCCTGNYDLIVTDGTTGEVTASFGLPWGGLPSDCYGGAAFLDPDAVFAPDGFPRPKYEYPNGAAYTKDFHFDGVSDTYYSNVPLANHYLSADHNNDRPAGLTGDRAEADYVFQCMDHAHEVLAQITLKIREYNEESQLIDDGNPDTVGTEPVTGWPLDDIYDWAAATPGNTTWIQFGE